MVEAGTASVAAVAATNITKGMARDLLNACLPVPDPILQICKERLVAIGMRASLHPTPYSLHYMLHLTACIVYLNGFIMSLCLTTHTIVLPTPVLKPLTDI